MSAPTATDAEKKAIIAAIKAKPYSERTFQEKMALGKSMMIAGIWAASISGTAHGLIELPFVVPIEAAITQTQLNAKGWFWNVWDLAKKRALYRSLFTTAVGLIPKCWVHYAAINFWLAVLTSSGNMRKATPGESAMVGILTGASEVWFLTPFNFVKFRMQRPEWGYTSMVNCLVRVTKEEGILAFWKGNGAVFFRNSICMLGMLGFYNKVEAGLPKEITKFRALLTGIICGIIGSFMSYPFEMLRAARQHNVNFRTEMLAPFKQGFVPGCRRMLAGYLPGCFRITFHSAALGILIPRMTEFSEGFGYFRKLRDNYFSKPAQPAAIKDAPQTAPKAA